LWLLSYGLVESEELTDYQVVSSDMDEEPSDVENDFPVVQEDKAEATEDEVKEFKQILMERKRDCENYFR